MSFVVILLYACRIWIFCCQHYWFSMPTINALLNLLIAYLTDYVPSYFSLTIHLSCHSVTRYSITHSCFLHLMRYLSELLLYSTACSILKFRYIIICHFLAIKVVYVKKSIPQFFDNWKK